MSNNPIDPFKQSVVEFPKSQEISGGGSILTTALTGHLASISDRISPWGMAPHVRDGQLRKFWPTEPFLAGAIGSVAIRNAAFEWELEGSENLVRIGTDMLNGAIAGSVHGWVDFMLNWAQDFYTQDNGAFIEIIRDPGSSDKFKNERAPVVGISHLDSRQCQRTGNPMTPVIYTDRRGTEHKMKWYEVIPMSEFPSPIESMYGIGVCATSRVLRYAQIMQSIATFKDEKVSGRYFRAMHIVSGVSRQQITDVEKRGQEEADNQGQVRFILPAILASIDPEKPVSHVEIPLASLPDNFDFDVEMRWYISCLALGFAVDYQDFAPLPGGNIGSSSQSEILHKKSRGKGESMFMERLQNAFHSYGVLPRSVTFKFRSKDLQEDVEKAALIKAQSETLSILTRTDILDANVARQMLMNTGLLDKDLYDQISPEHGVSEHVNAGPGQQGNKQLLGTAGGTNEGQNISRTQKEAKEGWLDRFKNRNG